MKRIHYFILIILIAAFAYNSHSIFEKPATKKVEEIHYHAGFEIYKDGALMEFTDLGYMDVKPCGPDDEDKPHEHLEPEVHLHDGIGNIVHIHGKVAVWKDLFEKLHLDMSSASISAVIDGQPITRITDTQIKPYQRASIFINSPEDQKIKSAQTLEKLPIDYIKEIEKKSENCSN
ncbi:hypothetical protein KBC70_02705 [Candidatus Woesebacteria bacterium]|nr:hypothetical protein [Candidatus Woesebacteria bacterium]